MAAWRVNSARRGHLEFLRRHGDAIIRPGCGPGDSGEGGGDDRGWSRTTALQALGIDWYHVPMEAKIDSVGRIVVPKRLRDALGLKPGATVDVSLYGCGLNVVPGSRAARLEERKGRLVAVSKTPVSDDDMFRLLEETRR